MRRRNQRCRGARAALGWGLCFFVCAQLALNVIVEGWHPELCDPEFAARAALLRSRIAEEPGRPLLLVIGSSRTGMAFLPEVLPPLRTASGEQPLVFNFSHLNAGPAMNLVQLRRLLRLGIRPEWVVLEIMPPQLADEKQRISTSVAQRDDFPALARYFTKPLGAYTACVASRLVPWYTHRSFIVQHCAPKWVPPGIKLGQDEVALDRLGGDSSWQAIRQLDATEARRRTWATRAIYFPILQDFHVAAISDRATREFLDLCRQEGIHVALLLTPEGSEFQSWYPPDAWPRVMSYCAALGREYGVPVVNTRDWVSDQDFSDSHHALLPAAKTFTRRLGREVLQPLVLGELRPGSY
jgi:hypothetical protein